jgi:electron transport complex protein RnfD
MKLTVASSPHIRGDFRTSRTMMDGVLALVPALAVGIWQFGLRALGVTAVSICAAVVSE